MMPTMAASTGAAFFPSASPAARPSSTTRTFSFTPAPTASTASSALPRGLSSGSIGCTSRSFAPSNFMFFCVDTTVPITRPICICLPGLKACTTFDRPMIHDADDTGVDRRFDGIKREARFLAADEEDVLADAGADGVHGDQRTSGGLSVGCERLKNQELQPHEILVLARHDHISHDSRKLHYRF